MIIETQRSGEKYILAYGIKVTESDAAWQINIDGENHWLPKSQCSIEPMLDKGPRCVAVEIPRWLAAKKGIV